MSAAAPPTPAAGTAPPPKAPTAKEQKKSEQMANAQNGGEEEEEEPLVTDNLDNKDIHEILRDLRKDEVAELAQSSHNRRTVKINHIIPGTQTVDNYFALVALETERYLRYVFGTWWNFFTSFLFGGLGLFDMFSVFFFAFGGTILLGVVLVFCLGMHFPALVRLYYRWADKYGGGLGLVNSGNPNLFKALTTAQAEAAKRALSRPIKETKDSETQRFFNYDIAKFLLQLASVVYEHENDSIRAAVELTTDLKPSTFLPTSAAATAEIMTNLAPSVNLPGKLIDKLFPGDASAKVDSALKSSKGDKAIRDFAKHFGIDFEPVSELNNTSSAFCGFFWDPSSNWIVVAFKGTAPIEFSEWLSDFNAKLVPAGSYIDGFTKVHKGFKDRLFPDDVTELGGTRPYDTIALALKTLAKWLRKRQPKGTQINVWVTGHSLGCATASLAYSRWLMRHKDMGKKSVLRDAYLFAAPIVCDRASVDVFNAKMNADPKRRKTMWRITSNGDAVATCLPELGDYRSITVSPNNAFAFAHLGTEIKMRDHPYRSHVTGNHITHGAIVQIDSEFNADQIAQQRADKYKNPGEQKREWIGVALQKIPLIGRFVAHCTIYYWDQLDRVALTQCEWVIN